MRMRNYIIGMSFLLLLLESKTMLSQEALMAKANKMISITYGLSNIDKIRLENYMSKQVKDNQSIRYDYQLQFSHPIQIAFDYACSDFTTIGLGLNYYHYKLNETRTIINDTGIVESKASKLALQLRGIRYIVQRPKSVLYFFAGAGVRMRSVKYSSSDPAILKDIDIHQIPATRYDNYFPLSAEVGIGARFLVMHNIGLCVEVGAIDAVSRIGIFYSIKNKWRKSNDEIGW
ncbi:MAG: hypothetical protein RIQ62_1720 [Bacteroidota bacterium]